MFAIRKAAGFRYGPKIQLARNLQKCMVVSSAPKCFISVNIKQSKENETSSGPLSNMLKGIGWLGGFYSRNQITMRAARQAYLNLSAQANHEEFYSVCQLPDTFQSWFLIQQLHVYLCLVRCAPENQDGKRFGKHIVQYFWEDVELKMKLMKVDDRTVKSESSRELLSMFYGLLFAYDEGVLGSDKVLAAAIWRNLFFNSRDEATAQGLAELTKYIRREIKNLDSMDSEQFLTTGNINFGPPPLKIGT
eukprot:m.227463 g.227463  ORF g.227463 m.227463 type:complete len:248 (+) comp15973_c0_seq3:5148-5891(+)